MTLLNGIANFIFGSSPRIDRIIDTTREIRVEAEKMTAELHRKDAALRAISAEAKRGINPNATVRRLGKMADEALG